MLEEIKNEIKNHRRKLHTIPETGFEEFKTSEYLKTTLKSYGFEPQEICETGLYVFIKGKENKTIAFRTDIDALNIEEENDIDFKSTHIGKMHACGHDGHMSIMLGFAKYLSTIKEFKKNILLIFQPAEEGPGGAKNIVETGIFDKYNVEGIFGLHLFPNIKEGVIASKVGEFMSATAEIDIDIYGKGGHGAMPHTAIDSIVVTSKLIEAYQSIVSRNISPMENSVITFGKIEGGTARNIIAEHTRIEGTMRFFNKDVFEVIKNRIFEINEGFEKAFGIKIEVDLRPLYPAVINDKNLYSKFKNAIENSDLDYKEIPAIMLAEDFAYYQEAIPGQFFFLGTENKEKGFDKPLHNCQFNFDEKVLINGVKAYIAISKEYDLF
jgi:amidohydrolase